jgi:hypothetical protein
MSKINEKKQSRIEINWPIDVFLDDRKIEGEAKNITPKGLFVCCEEALNLKENFSISIFPPNRKAVNVIGKAIWSDFYAIDDKNTPVCVGMSFVEISAKDRHFLKEMIQVPKEK